MTSPGPTPEPPVYDGPRPIIPSAQLRAQLLTPGQEPLCYERHPDTGRICNLTMYHPGDHRCITGNGVYAYWPSEMPPGPIPDPNPLPDQPPPIEPPESAPDTQVQAQAQMPTSESELEPLPESEQAVQEPAPGPNPELVDA